MPQTHPWELVSALFREAGSDAYFGEDVTQLEHALQCAALATYENAPETLVVAALLHDIGHLLHGRGHDIADQGIDANHEAVGGDFLERYFPESVAAPARGHVEAKRYLCAVEPGYWAALSPASKKSLELQGGAMDSDECREFEKRPFFHETIRLRRWDDTAKDPATVVPGIDAYQTLVLNCTRDFGNSNT